MDDFSNINVSNMVKGDHIIKNVKGINIGIYKIDEDKYSVFKMTCPHMGGDLCFFKNKKNNTAKIKCSWHGYTYDISGKFVENPNIINNLEERKETIFFNPKTCEAELKKLTVEQVNFILEKDSIKITNL